MIFQVGNMLFNSAHIRYVKGSDGCDCGIYVAYVNGVVDYIPQISLEEFVQALKKERIII